MARGLSERGVIRTGGQARVRPHTCAGRKKHVQTQTNKVGSNDLGCSASHQRAMARAGERPAVRGRTPSVRIASVGSSPSLSPSANRSGRPTAGARACAT
eukprot:scaffold6473_cov76-Phaeocystis_antarctica.AAC.2